MGMVVANNVPSLNAQHYLTRSSQGLAKSLERLSSGFKVNRGADGPAALVISEKQRAQIAGLRKAIENSEKAVSLVQTAEGALNEINSLLIRIRSLALDSSNAGVNDQNALQANQDEIDNALETIDRIANNTQFGTRKLLDGASGITATLTSSNVSFLKATKDTQEGSYLVAVTTVGNASQRDGGTNQTTALAADEILTINGIDIPLRDRTDQDSKCRNKSTTLQVKQVWWPRTRPSGTQLYTTAFGSDVTLERVQQCRRPRPNSSGFGNDGSSATREPIWSERSAVPRSTGKGNVLTGTSGAGEGVHVAVRGGCLERHPDGDRGPRQCVRLR